MKPIIEYPILNKKAGIDNDITVPLRKIELEKETGIKNMKYLILRLTLKIKVKNKIYLDIYYLKRNFLTNVSNENKY